MVIPTDDELERLSAKGWASYEENLQAILEPQFNGQIVAIHLDSGDYEVAGNSPTAARKLRVRHPQDLTMTTNIGPAKRDGC